VEAIADAGDLARGATAYVTLEPCGHTGKTPPCAKALIDAGVRRVLYSAADVDRVTAGKGPETLLTAGVQVAAGLLSERAIALNTRFAAHLEAAVPWTIAKWAMTLDGKIADVTGGSRYITGPESRQVVQETRASVDAVCVGVGTAIADDPDLTARDVTIYRKAIRLVLDPNLRLPVDARMVRESEQTPTWIACAEDAPNPERFKKKGVKVIKAPRSDRGLDLRTLFMALRREGIGRILLEGGGKIHAAALAAGIVKQVMAFTAPMILGGADAPTPVDGEGLRRIGEALRLQESRITTCGEDVLVEGYVTESGQFLPSTVCKHDRR
jgi:diaminohydroxyphosphoribosylaminopyrimidine deaminase/5-amino-6-(5-phosphoribosylamino)uracil reductase